MNLLLVRTSALGDVVQNLPVLRALRRALPAARIGWLVEETFAPLLTGHPDLADVFPVATRRWRREGRRATLAGFAALRRRLRGFAPDVALDLMGNHKGGFLARLSGARRVVGPARRDRREPSSALWMSETVAVPSVHAVDRGLDLLRALGVDPEPVDFGPGILLPTPPPEATAALDGLPARFVTVQAGAGWANKTYPAALWGEVARRLRGSTGLPTVVPVAPGERRLAEEVVAASDGAARAAPAPAFATLAAVLRRSALVLGGDTGPLHLAHALGVPVLCLLGPTDPARHGPYRTPERALFRRLPCSFCHKRFAEPKACLLDVAPAEVAARAAELLAADGFESGAV